MIFLEECKANPEDILRIFSDKILGGDISARIFVEFFLGWIPVGVSGGISEKYQNKSLEDMREEYLEESLKKYLKKPSKNFT